MKNDQIKYLKHNRNDRLLLIYFTVILFFSQMPAGTIWLKFVFFISVPLLCFLVVKPTRLSLLSLNKLLYLKIIIFIGLVVGLIHLNSYDNYFFTRDILYFTQAYVYIVIGIYICRNVYHFNTLLKIIVLSCMLMTVYKLFALIINPSLIFELGLKSRYESDLANPGALILILILFYTRRCKIRLFKNHLELIMLVIGFFSVLISFSRTFYLLLVATLFLGFIINKNRLVYLLFSGLVVLSLFILFGSLVIDFETGIDQGSTFIEKINHSLDEVVVREYETKEAINNNWRGYEAYLGLSKFYDGNIFQLLFGQGLGVVVNTPYWIFKGENNLSVLPMFHNGFVTIILKTGLVGLLCFYLFLFKLLEISVRNFKKSKHPYQKLALLLLQAGVFIILISTFVVHGIFTTTISFVLMILMGVSIKLGISKLG